MLFFPEGAGDCKSKGVATRKPCHAWSRWFYARSILLPWAIRSSILLLGLAFANWLELTAHQRPCWPHGVNSFSVGPRSPGISSRPVPLQILPVLPLPCRDVLRSSKVIPDVVDAVNTSAGVNMSIAYDGVTVTDGLLIPAMQACLAVVLLGALHNFSIHHYACLPSAESRTPVPTPAAMHQVVAALGQQTMHASFCFGESMVLQN
jgi:hypothetical protein